MISSLETDQLDLALMAFHKEFGVVVGKDKKGARANYSTLPGILEFIDEGCAKHGLVFYQGSFISDLGMALRSKLSHPASKQWITCESLLTPATNSTSPDQAWGGSTTYHRRYDAMMLLGLFCSDDVSDNDGEAPSLLISEAQARLLSVKIAGNKAKEEKIYATLGVKSLSDIQKKDFNNTLAFVEKN